MNGASEYNQSIENKYFVIIFSKKNKIYNKI